MIDAGLLISLAPLGRIDCLAERHAAGRLNDM
jgi:hypothetical protein